MYDKTDQANRQVNPPPISPVLLPFKGGRTLWQALFNGVLVRDQPRFIALFVRWNEQDRDYDLAPNEPRGYEQTANRAALADETLQRAVLYPLLARLHDTYSEETHLLILSSGKVFASDEQDAIDAVVHGTPPVDPSELHISPPEIMNRVWSAGRLLRDSRDPRMRALGLVACLGALAITSAMAYSWYFAMFRFGESLHAILASIHAPYQLSMLLAIALSAFEIVGVLIPPLRRASLVVSAIDMTIHLWYGYTLGAAIGDPESIRVFWSLLLGAFSIFPEWVFMLFIGLVWYTFPLFWRWLPKQIVRIGKDGLTGWRTPELEDETIEGYVIDDVRDGRRVTRYLKG